VRQLANIPSVPGREGRGTKTLHKEHVAAHGGGNDCRCVEAKDSREPPENALIVLPVPVGRCVGVPTSQTVIQLCGAISMGDAAVKTIVPAATAIPQPN